MAHSGIEQEIDKVNEIDDRKGNLNDFFLKNEFSLLLSKQYVALLNDLTCKCLPPSGLARQVSDIFNIETNLRNENLHLHAYAHTNTYICAHAHKMYIGMRWVLKNIFQQRSTHRNLTTILSRKFPQAREIDKL